MRQIIAGQKVKPEKAAAARCLRKRMTEAESAIWKQVRRGNIKGLKFRRQQVIDGFIVDFYCEQSGLVIEIDGDVHKGQVVADKEREAILRERGLTVLRFTNDEVLKDAKEVAGRIKQAVTP